MGTMDQIRETIMSVLHVVEEEISECGRSGDDPSTARLVRASLEECIDVIDTTACEARR